MSLLTFFDIIGVVAFSITGALLGIKKKMDYFGVCILGIIASVGGGVTRDVIIGSTPPVMFSDPIFVTVAFVVSNLVFITLYFKMTKGMRKGFSHTFETVLFWFDTIGLAVFTVDGVIVGQTFSAEPRMFLSVFLGVITGVGGGILRDLLAGEVPAILVKHIYAIASIAGAIAVCMLWSVLPQYATIAVGLSLVTAIRFLARKYKWNLPRIK